jgi:hypothetical protein
MSRHHIVLAVFAGLAAAAPAPASAAITPTREATAVAGAMADSATVTVTGASFVTAPPSGDPIATFDAALGGYPTAGSTAALLTNGDAKLAGDANGSGSTGGNDGGAAVRGDTDRDVTVLKVDLTIPGGANCLTIDFKFFSEEYPEFVGKSVNDAFVAELDESNWTTAANTISAPKNFAFDPQGNVVSINATGVAGMNAEAAAGTTYDGATAPLHASTTVTPGAHSLYLSIFDQGDNIYDSAVMLDNIRSSTVSGGCKAGATDQPTPASGSGGPVGTKPPAFGPNGVIQGLPSAKKCVSRRTFRIRIRKRKGRTYISASVFVNGKRVGVVRGARLTAPVNLQGLPAGRFTVKIVVITETGEVIQGTRRYITCFRGRLPGRRGGPHL